jgi:hypothetical protein
MRAWWLAYRGAVLISAFFLAASLAYVLFFTGPDGTHGEFTVGQCTLDGSGVYTCEGTFRPDQASLPAQDGSMTGSAFLPHGSRVGARLSGDELTMDKKQTILQQIGQWRIVGLAATISSLAFGRATRRRQPQPSPPAPVASG